MDTVGLVLTVFPLIVQSLSFYINARNYASGNQESLNYLVRELQTQREIFQDTCEKFLDQIFPTQVVSTLIGGVGWNDRALQDALRRCLNPDAADAFTNAVEEFFSILKCLSDNLGLGNNYLVCI
jgi:hypothetical protein